MTGSRAAVRSIARGPIAAAIVLLCGVGADRLAMPRPADATAYHRAVAQASAAIPTRIGTWIGEDVPVPSAAVTMLSPNVLLSRRYVDTATGREARLLLVQCGDARDMTAHYPPVCLVNSGWTLTESRPRDWLVGATRIPGTEYRFAMRSFGQMSAIIVCNFMALPDGRLARDMGPVTAAADDVTHRYFGAAQVQVVLGADVTEAERDAAVSTLVGGLGQTLHAIGAEAVR